MPLTQKPQGYYAKIYFVKLSELLQKVTTNPAAAAQIVAAMVPALAQMTVPPTGPAAVKAMAMIIQQFSGHMTAFAKKIVADKAFVIGKDPAPTSGGMDSKTIMLLGAAGVAALILLKK